MKIDIQLAESLLEAFNHEETGILLWDKNDKLIFRNDDIQKRFIRLQVPYQIGQSFYERMVNLKKHKNLPNEDVKRRIKNYEKAKSSKKPQEMVIKGPTDRWVQVKDTLTPSGNVLTLFTNVTKIVQQNEERKRLATAIENVPIGVMFWDENDNLISNNEKSRGVFRSMGMPVIDIGTNFKQMLEQNVRAGAYILEKGITKGQYIKKRLEDRKKLKISSNEQTYKDGSTMLINQIRLQDGSLMQLFTDITEIKKKEEELERLSVAIESVPSGIHFWDEENKLIFANKMARDLHMSWNFPFKLKKGVKYEDLYRSLLSYNIFQSPKGMSLDEAVKQRLKNRNDITSGSREIQLNNGSTFVASEIRLDEGSVLSIFSDVSDLKEKENQARFAEKRLQEAIDSMPHGISLWDKNDVLVMNNKYAHNIHKKAGINNYSPGITFEEQSRLWKEKNFLKFESDSEKEDYYEKAFKNRKSFTGTRTIEVPQFYDDSFWSATYTRLEDNGVFTIFSNITELKNRENQLRKTISQLDDEKEKANAANKTKSQFLANMSHELRTPLNAIIGLTEMLKEDATDDGLDDFVEPLDRVFNAGKHLLTLINDVLDLSKIEAGKIDLYNEVFELRPVIDDIVKTSEPLASKNQNKLVLNFDLKIDQVTSDQTRIKQVVLNLLSNACKFTENGTITLEIKKKNRTFIRNGRKFSLGDLITIDISDTGIGMTQDQMDRLFNSFVQADSSTTRKYGGTGLGLTISKQLAIMMGGDVQVKSVINEGTTFSFTFLEDYKDASEVTRNRRTNESSLIKNVVSIENQNTIENKNTKTILVIDDDPTVSELMKRQLTKTTSYNVVIASNGKDGVKLAREIKPNLITLDILMPEMDGWSVLRTLKADPQVSSIPVIMASILDEKNKGFSLGASDFVSKPIEKDKLLNSIQNLIGKNENLKVCIIEDDENLRFTIRELLQKQGNTVIEAKNGKVGIELLQKEESLPDLILLDLMMPEMNGFEFLNQIKGTKLKSIPVLVLTGADLKDKDIKFLKGETEKIIHKTDDSIATITEEINRVLEIAG